MAFTQPRTWNISDVVTAAMLNSNLRDNMAAVAARCMMFVSGIYTVAASTTAAFGGMSSAFDTTDTMCNGTRITCKQAGTYLLAFGTASPDSSHAWTAQFLRKNGTTTLATTPGNAGGTPTALAVFAALAVSDYVEACVTTTLACTVNPASYGGSNYVAPVWWGGLTVAQTYTATFCAQWMGP